MGTCTSSTLAPEDKLYVILPLFNPAGYIRRETLFKLTFNHVLLQPRVRVITVELATGSRRFATDQLPQHPRWIKSLKYRSEDVFWAKENLINLGVSAAFEAGASDSDGIAFLDADIIFDSWKWAERTLLALRQSHFVQMFEKCDLCGPDGSTQLTVSSFAYRVGRGETWSPVGNTERGYFHPGFAWAARPSALRSVPLLDRTLGSADLHLATALIGRVGETIPEGISTEYRGMVMRYQTALSGMGAHLGCVPGSIQHLWHGSLRNRKYVERWDILKRHGFGPAFLARSTQNNGLLGWTDAASPAFRADVIEYFSQRDEDADREPPPPPRPAPAVGASGRQPAALRVARSTPAAGAGRGRSSNYRAGSTAYASSSSSSHWDEDQWHHFPGSRHGRFGGSGFRSGAAFAGHVGTDHHHHHDHGSRGGDSGWGGGGGGDWGSSGSSFGGYA